MQGEDDRVLRGASASDIDHPHPTAIPGRVEPARDRRPRSFPTPLAPCPHLALRGLFSRGWNGSGVGGRRVLTSPQPPIPSPRFQWREPWVEPAPILLRGSAFVFGGDAWGTLASLHMGIKCVKFPLHAVAVMVRGKGLRGCERRELTKPLKPQRPLLQYGLSGPVARRDHRRAVGVAEAVLRWAARQIGENP